MNAKISLLFLAFWNIIYFLFFRSLDDINQLFIHIFGGVSIKEYYFAPDIIEIFRWSIIVFLPVAISLFFFNIEKGHRCYFTLIRHKSAVSWILKRVISIILLNVYYIFLGVATFVIWNINDIYKMDIKLLLLTMILLSLFLISVTMFCMAFMIVFTNKGMPFISYTIINVISLGVGVANNDLIMYSYACFGMVARSNYVNKSYGLASSYTTILMASFILANILFMVLYFKKNKYSSMLIDN